LFKIRSEEQIDESLFVYSLKYVLEFKLGRPCLIYNCKNGVIDFSINSIRFKFTWPPENTIKLVYNHLEGTTQHDSEYTIMCEDPLYDLIKNIEFYTLYARPDGN
jgi:hypothetical protein